MAHDDDGKVHILQTCSYACEIDFSEIFSPRAPAKPGRISIVQGGGTLRLRVEGSRQEIELESTEKQGEAKTKVHKYRFK